MQFGKVHFVAIGGAVMHNLAIALSRKGIEVTGSDDHIFDPSRSRLEREGLLPSEMGWHPERVTSDLDAIILGMHARTDNPELARAKELGIPVYSFPSFLGEYAQDKKRIVIAGSHGKTTITSMILHVCKKLGKEVDYMVGAQIEGYDCMVGLSDAPVMIFEGDEYLTSPEDRRPKFVHYNPHVAVMNGIAWDHINVFPTYENYVEQFQMLLDFMVPGGLMLYNELDKEVIRVVDGYAPRETYSLPAYSYHNGKAVVNVQGEKVTVDIFGRHNMNNAEASRLVCEQLDINAVDFYRALSDFKGAGMRLEKWQDTDSGFTVFRDFAHSPSKLKATVSSVKEAYPDRKVIAFMELHTFSSLSAKFLDEYKGSMADADQAYVYFNPTVVEQKKLESITPGEVAKGFGLPENAVLHDRDELRARMEGVEPSGAVLLLMSSGNFDGLPLREMTEGLAMGPIGK